ncbi:hypothetical protein AB0M43_38310 [Longispora sp. NPDC051575]|uniref:hypothetical protein n=1 Tax=Longispora sp. NPDC051575 TaxID=3154943 RepID=UPI00342337C1
MLRSGQLRIALRDLEAGRTLHPTGVQVQCAGCARSGIERQGLPFRIEGDPTPLCIPCGTGRQERARRAGLAELSAAVWEAVGQVEAAESECPVCADQAADAGRRGIAATRGCWLCGHEWLADVRAQVEAARAADQAAVNAEFARLAVRAEAEAERDAWRDWTTRINDQLAAHRDGRGFGRSVDLLAGGLFLLYGPRASRRGRKGGVGLVMAAMATAADWRSGRSAMPGREWVARLAGCKERSVSRTWRATRLPAVDNPRGCGWMHETVRGGRLSLDERLETGRWNNRSVFDLRPVHHFTTDQLDPWREEAVALLTLLLANAAEHLDHAEAALAELAAVTRDEIGAAWVSAVRRTRLRAAVAGTIHTHTLAATATERETYFVPPSVGALGEYSSSCLVLGEKTGRSIHSRQWTGARPTGREGEGAPRSSPRAGARPGSPPLERPRRHQRGVTSKIPRQRPEWADWAYVRADQLAEQDGYGWMVPDEDRREVRMRIASTIGRWVPPEWSAEELAAKIQEYRGGRRWPEQVDDPAAYLRALLKAMTPDGYRRTVAEYQTVHHVHRAEVAAAAVALAAVAVATEDRPAEASARFAALRAQWAAKKAAAAPAVEDWPELPPPVVESVGSRP